MAFPKLLMICVHLSVLACVMAGSSAPAIFIFGDSIFDAGNNHYNPNCTAQADFPPYGSDYFHRPTGRFTNGRTVPDFISQFIGIPLQKPFLEVQLEIVNGTRKNYPSNGINFASAGSGVLPATNNESGVTPIQVQLQQFQTLVEQNRIDRKILNESLFFLESGSNDIFNYFFPFDTPTLTPDAYVQSMLTEVRNVVDTIYKLGARRIALFALGPVGCVPARILLPGSPVTRYPGAVGVYGAVYKTVQTFRANPKLYGFADVESGCCGYGTLGGELQCGKEGYRVCKNPNEYLFWDFFHPSERTYKLISKALWGPTHIQPSI
ncbi:UNVERIFIED_CONTAM: GDSL esterase/lipase 6 [Sesamum calycinum]|uniref:GDSL esterase/lipase 6 n=1 Tax=Sesamum calycinum TaxID=2727403 RepID=A0AAW2QXY5_9LAMI